MTKHADGGAPVGGRSAMPSVAPAGAGPCGGATQGPSGRAAAC